MAYINKETAAEMRKEIKAMFPNYKFSVTIQNSSTVVCSILESDVDFTFNGDYETKFRTSQVNYYNIEKNYLGKELELLQAINKVLHKGHYDRSDVMTDYFDVAWYVKINIGKWDKPYIYKPN